MGDCTFAVDKSNVGSFKSANLLGGMQKSEGDRGPSTQPGMVCIMLWVYREDNKGIVVLTVTSA